MIIAFLGKKKKNGYTILNPANEIFGLGHYPRLSTAYKNINTLRYGMQHDSYVYFCASSNVLSIQSICVCFLLTLS